MSEMEIERRCAGVDGDTRCPRTDVIAKGCISGLPLCSKHYQREWRQANPDYHRRRRAANPEPYRAAVRRFRVAHLDESRARDRRYYELNKDKVKEKNRRRYADGGKERARERRRLDPQADRDAAARWRSTHNARMRAASQTWRDSHPEAAAAVGRNYRDNHPEAVRAAWRRARARKLGAFIAPYLDVDIFERDQWVCQLCKRPIDPSAPRNDPWGASIDHIIPLDPAWGGTDQPANVWAAHLRCNLRKGPRFSGLGPGPKFFRRAADNAYFRGLNGRRPGSIPPGPQRPS